jgi:hypothetical protein
VASVGAVEVYACWSGDEAEVEHERTIVSSGTFSGDADAFSLSERWFATVVETTEAA